MMHDVLIGLKSEIDKRIISQKYLSSSAAAATTTKDA